MRQWAEEELIVPDGDFKGFKYKTSRQPAARLWFDEVDSGRWNRFAFLGPQQSGKSLSGYIIPALYHLFEQGETVICGLPAIEMARDKWEIDFMPVIEASRYRELLPEVGPGSKGGMPILVTFRNGAKLRFMSGGGRDSKRAAFTSRILVVTEADKLDEVGGTSREADKLQQMEGRTRFYRDRKRVYLECTVSIEEGRIWQEYQNGSRSRILLPCPHCEDWVSPEREDFRGWDEAENELDAEDRAAFHCPNCEAPWSEEDRHAANAVARLVHRGQEVTPDGDVVGELPKTRTLGFRYSAVNNLFVSSASIGADEWNAQQSTDPETADRALCQWVWAIPPEDTSESSGIDEFTVGQSLNGLPRGEVPDGAERLTAMIDVGKFRLHWIIKAWASTGEGATIDYGEHITAQADVIGAEKAIEVALNELHDEWRHGYNGRQFDAILVDSGNWNTVIFGRVKHFGRPWWASMGDSRFRMPPKNTAEKKRGRGGPWYKSRQAARVWQINFDPDWWKHYVHNRYLQDVSKPAAFTIFGDDPREHIQYGRQVAAERWVSEWVDGKGHKEFWRQVHRHNHYLDCEVGATVAAAVAGQVFDPQSVGLTVRRGNARRRQNAPGVFSWLGSGSRPTLTPGTEGE